jgi:hypothetical protein
MMFISSKIKLGKSELEDAEVAQICKSNDLEAIPVVMN